jgi:hypothetical protein
MLLPIAPWDMGLSLNRGVRYVGGNVLGLWPEYQGLNDPGDYAQKFMELGPIYSAELFDRLISPLFGGDEQRPAPLRGLIPTTSAQ